MSDFYTVSQYASISGKDPGNIRRMLIKGTLEGEKVGNQWLIPRNVIFPDDRRVKNGKYRNWRQRVKLNSKHPNLMKRLSQMCDEIGAIYQNGASEIVLYGSYARGQETEESDVDIAIVLTDNQTDEQYGRMTDVVVDYELELGITLSVISIEQREFIEWKTTLPFYKNIEKEGISLWKSV